MSRRAVAPKHRARRTTRLRHTLNRHAALAGVAVAATATVVTVGVTAAEPPDPAVAAAALVSSGVSAEERAALDASREQRLSRSDRRTDVDRTKAQRLTRESRSGGQVTRDKELGGGDPRLIAQGLLPEFGFSADQFSCLDALWTKESGWNPAADNPTSSAYGIPQALPGSKMASAGPDWATNPATQIRWGLGYIADSYGTPCSAWAHSQASGWY
ncbi:MAG TPA: lytic transglycosylase domain-containing protein [Marmoricola sp.]|nr:lytic transglycosylase domain-containing protein [Marmoricola sp.]